jgi:hypothetical protein
MIGADTMSNSIVVISPYWYAGTWVFDDDSAGLNKEPFVLYIPEMINALLSHIPNAHEGFRLLFSGSTFPSCQIEIEWVREESSGNWYRTKGQTQEGWLCLSLFKYFETTPKSIFVKAEQL